MIQEVWKPISSHPGYDVSNLGRVRSYWVPGRNAGYIADSPQRIRTLHICRTNGYHILSLKRTDGKQSRCSVYTLVANAFLGPRPNGLEICHNDGNPLNSVESNLRYDTRRNNYLDAVKHGKHGKHGRNLGSITKYKHKLGINILKILLATG